MSRGQTTEVVQSYLPMSDQEDLQWFFTDGQVCFERSLFGMQLERAERLTFGTEPCAKCDGKGYSEDPEISIRRAIDEVKRWQESNARIQQENARRAILARADLPLPKKPKLTPPNYDDGTCRSCLGCGMVPVDDPHPQYRRRVTVWPTGSSVRAAGIEPSSGALETYGYVSLRLKELELEHIITLEGFFGMAGERWDEDPSRGRIWGVLPLTEHGRKLVRMSREKTQNEGTLTDDQVLNVEMELELLAPDETGKRSALFVRGIEEAEKRLRDAETAWRGREEETVAELDPLESAERVLTRTRELLWRLAS